ncbi:hypothetical protein ACLOJK_030805 [Asimina triloba]
MGLFVIGERAWILGVESIPFSTVPILNFEIRSWTSEAAMSSILNTSGGRPYGLSLDIVKSPSSLAACSSHSSSPSSGISDSSNSPLAISTRKPRTPRKRPNQTYNEAAALLSELYPSIFSSKHLRKPRKHARSNESFPESSELLPTSPSFDNASFLLAQPIPERPISPIELKPSNSIGKPRLSITDTEIQPTSPPEPPDGYDEDFDAESILDEEVEEGIDSIMGNLSVNNDSSTYTYNFAGGSHFPFLLHAHSWNLMGFAFGGRLEFGRRFGRNVRALKQVEDQEWWRSPTVEVADISPRFKVTDERKKKSSSKKKKNKKVVEVEEELLSLGAPEVNSRPALGLKLNYEEVLNAWSDRGSAFSKQISKPSSRKSSMDANARLKNFDLHLEMVIEGEESFGAREASMLRYKEKKRNRLFSKKIRYQVRKVNADRRPRTKAIKPIELPIDLMWDLPN